MTPETATQCRDILDRLRAQVETYLPRLALSRGDQVTETVVPLDRLPLVAQVVGQLMEAEAVFAQAQQSSQESDPATVTA